MSDELEIDHETKIGRARARAIFERDLDAALVDAVARLEEEQLFVEALRREMKIRLEQTRILEVGGGDSMDARLYERAKALITATAIVDADEKIEAMEARRKSAA